MVDDLGRGPFLRMSFFAAEKSPISITKAISARSSGESFEMRNLVVVEGGEILRTLHGHNVGDAIEVRHHFVLAGE